MEHSFTLFSTLLLVPLETLYQEHGHEWSL